MAKMVRFQVNMPLRDQLAPLPGDRHQVEASALGQQEAEGRVRGVKGAWHWLMGRGLPTGKELYAKMIAEADDMMMAMEEGREVDNLQEVMMYSGLETGER